MDNRQPRNPLKNALFSSLYHSGGFSFLTGMLTRLRKEHPCVILVYHQVVDGRSEYLDKGPVVHHHLSNFAEEIAYLKRHYDILTMDEVVERLDSGRGFGRPSVAITFDDGYLDNYTLAYSVLRKHKVPATIYLTTGLVGTSEMTWTDQIEHALLRTEKESIAFERLQGEGPVSIRTQEEKATANIRIAEAFKSLPDGERKALLKRLFDVLGVDEGGMRNSPSRKMLNWDEVREMAENGITFGSHSHTHPILSRLPLEEAKQDILTSKRVMEEKLGRPVKHFAFPNGRPQDFSPELGEYCTEIGFESVATVVYGVTNPRSDSPFGLRRVGAMSPMWLFAKNLAALFLKYGVGKKKDFRDSECAAIHKGMSAKGLHAERTVENRQ